MVSSGWAGEEAGRHAKRCRGTRDAAAGGMTESTPSVNGVDVRPAEPSSRADSVPTAVPTARPTGGTPKGLETRSAEPTRPAFPPPPDVARKPSSEPLPENVAATLAYLFGWAGGLAFLLFDRRPYVRFHAAQSVMVFGALSLVLLVLGGFLLGTLLPNAGAVLLLLQRVVELVWIVAAIGLMLNASSGERYRVPYVAKRADRLAGGKT